MRKLLFHCILLLFMLVFVSSCQFTVIHPESYTISFESNGGSAVLPIKTASGNPVKAPDDPLKDGYTFEGWYSDEALTHKYVFTVMPSGDLTLYGKWAVNVYTVQFVDYNGTVLKTIGAPVGGNVTPPGTPSRDGYIFLGWDKAYNNIQTNLTVNAVYVPDYLSQALSSFQFIFSAGDSAGSVKNSFSYPASFDNNVNYYCQSSNNAVISFNNDTHVATVTQATDVTKVTVTVYAYVTRYDGSKDSLTETIDLTVPELTDENGNPLTVNKESLIVSNNQSLQDAVNSYYTYEGDDYTYNLLPSTGTDKILVIPIQFPDAFFTDQDLATINYGYFGDGSKYDTVKSYYAESSYGKLSITGTVLPVYTAVHDYSYYEAYHSNRDKDADGVDALIEEAISFYKQTDPTLDLSQFDRDGDRNLDGVEIVYSAPVDYTNYGFYWAYQYYYYPTSGTADSDYMSWNDYYVNAYVFSGMDFFYDGGDNALTVIHETGHLLGLDDYYDYTDNDSLGGSLGGADMMDGTVGDQDAFSKLLLNWINPIVVSQSCTVTINKFETSGDAILITDHFTSVFSEYFMVDFYTPDELNATDKYLTADGLIMYHIDAKLPADYSNLPEYSYYFLYNNSDSQYQLIKFEEADGNNIERTGEANNSDLLEPNHSHTLVMYDNEPLCTVKVLSMTDSTITVSFIFNS